MPRDLHGAGSPTLYFMCEDVSDLPWFLDWFRRRHAPDVLAAGFLSAFCYRLVEGRQQIWDIYEIDSVDVFHSDAYAKVAREDEEIPYAMSLLSNRSVTLYKQIAPASPAWLNSRFLVVHRFACTRAPRTPSEGPGGATRWRLGRRARRQHPQWPSTEPEYVMITEHESLDDVSRLSDAEIREWLDVPSVVGDRAVIERAHGFPAPQTMDQKGCSEIEPE